MATERNTTPAPEKNSFERPPKKSLTAWVLLLPLALLIGVLWQSWREPEPSVLPVVGDQTLSPKPHRKPTATTKAPTATKPLPAKLTIFVPNDNAMLEPKSIDNPVTKSSGDPDKDYIKIADASLNVLGKQASDLFPAGSFLGSVRREGDLVSVNLSKKWYEMPQWSQGSSLSMLAQDAIVNTLAAAGGEDGKSIKVQFLQEGKPAALLGELDMSEPLSPNPDMVAKG